MDQVLQDWFDDANRITKQEHVPQKEESFLDDVIDEIYKETIKSNYNS